MPAAIQEKTSERKLLEACKRGDHAAFEKLYLKYKDKIYNIALYMSSDPETAKDLMQQIFLKAYSALQSFKFQSQFSTWLVRITINMCIDHRRRQKRADFVPIETSAQHLDMGDSADSGALRAEINRALDAAVKKMSEKLRQVVVLKYIGDLSYSEISETLGLSIGTVSSRLNRGHQFLARELEEFKET